LLYTIYTESKQIPVAGRILCITFYINQCISVFVQSNLVV